MHVIESILIGQVTDIFNKVFNAGYFPEIWSHGFIAPKHKKANNSDYNNYRRIILLSNLGKMYTSISPMHNLYSAKGVVL